MPPRAYRGRVRTSRVFALVLAVVAAFLAAGPAEAATRPDTTITAGPSGTVGSSTATFRFRSTARHATFQCRLDAHAWKKCTSPKTYRGLADAKHVFRVRARKDGRTDRSPAVRRFEVITPITFTQAFIDAAAGYYLPAEATFDVPASCATDPQIDCPGGVPDPVSDQVHLASTYTLTQVPEASRVDLSAVSDVATLAPVHLSTMGVTCDLSVDSAGGLVPTWGGQVSLNFVTDPVTGVMRIVPSDPTFSNVEVADFSLSPHTPADLLCSVVASSLGLYLGSLESSLASLLLGQSLCAAPGEPLVEPCPTP